MTQGKKSFSGQKLSYYFDQVTKDCLDLQVSTSQWDEWLRLRPKVLSLPQETFKITLAAVEAILDHAVSEVQNNSSHSKKQSKNQQAASSLYEQVRKDTRDKTLRVKTVE